MALFRRWGMFFALNILVVVTLSVLTRALGLDRAISRQGLNPGALMGFCLVWGMGGALISLALSRVIAKMSMGVRLIDPLQAGGRGAFVHATVARLAAQAGLPCTPEVGIYDAPEINAFATGPTRSRALVAVSSGLLACMRDDEVAGVLAHEVSHIANGDMVTMTLLQGVVNAFAMFLARAIAWALAQARSQDRDGERGGSGGLGAYFLVQMLLEFVFLGLGSLLVAWFSRLREFRADAGGAALAGTGAMVAALQRLRGDLAEASEPPAEAAATAGVRTLQISGRPSRWLELLSSHPPLQTRIARLQQGRGAGGIVL